MPAQPNHYNTEKGQLGRSAAQQLSRRSVWFDFSGNRLDHTSNLSRSHIEADTRLITTAQFKTGAAAISIPPQNPQSGGWAAR